MARNAMKTGASRQKAKRSFSFDFDMSNSLRWGKPVALVLLLSLSIGAISYYSFFGIGRLLEIPVQQVSVKGDLQYQSQQEIQTVINRFVSDGYIKTDLEDLRQQLIALPWIEQVTIRRKLNNVLQLELLERKPMAYWNAKHLIGKNGEVFTPVNLPNIAGLVRLSGDEHERVMALYHDLNAQLLDGQAIAELHATVNQTLAVQLVSGMKIIMQEDNMTAQLKNFRAIMKNGLVGRIEKVESIDLRYNNGAAVAWQNDSVALNHNRYVGAGK